MRQKANNRGVNIWSLVRQKANTRGVNIWPLVASELVCFGAAYLILNFSELGWTGFNFGWVGLEKAGFDWAVLCICVRCCDNVRSLQRLLDTMSFSNAQPNFTITVCGIRACQKCRSFPDPNFRTYSDTGSCDSGLLSQSGLLFKTFENVTVQCETMPFAFTTYLFLLKRVCQCMCF